MVKHYGLITTIEIVKEEDLEGVEAREKLLRSIVSSENFLTLQELADRVESFAIFLNENRKSLLSTGYPASRHIGWPAPLAVNLYPVHVSQNQLNDMFDPRRDDRKGNASVDQSPVISWCYRSPRAVDGMTDQGTASETPQKSSKADASSRENLPHAEFLEPEDIGRLEQDRPILLGLKICLLERLVQALERGSGVGLWADCLRKITDALLGSQADFYLNVDQKWGVGIRQTGGLAQHNIVEILPGGFTELLELVGYCEKELTVGTMDQTKTSLESLVNSKDRDPYIKMLRSSRRPAVDAALDTFKQLYRAEADFWRDFQGRVNTALRDDFAEEVTIRTRISRPYAAQIEPYLRVLADWSRNSLEQTGILPEFQLSHVAVPIYRFQQQGRIWALAYKGLEVHLTDRKGLHHLAYLLNHPGQPIHVLEIMRAAEGSHMPNDSMSGVSTEALLEEIGASLEGFGDAGPLIDQKAKRQILANIHEIDEDIRDAEGLGDVDRAEELRGTREELLQYLSAGFGIRGRVRKAASPDNRARPTVTKAIGRALDEIARIHPELREHLAAITTGSYCCYMPLDGHCPDWEF